MHLAAPRGDMAQTLQQTYKNGMAQNLKKSETLGSIGL